jgi:hypothetical protein
MNGPPYPLCHPDCRDEVKKRLRDAITAREKLVDPATEQSGALGITGQYRLLTISPNAFEHRCDCIQVNQVDSRHSRFVPKALNTSILGRDG